MDRRSMGGGRRTWTAPPNGAGARCAMLGAGPERVRDPFGDWISAAETDQPMKPGCRGMYNGNGGDTVIVWDPFPAGTSRRTMS
jgi:hypothetical protein